MNDIIMSAVKSYKRIYSINEAAEVLKVHQQTLRNWERHQLIVPMRAAQRRIYTQKDISICGKIKEFSDKGISLKRIKELLKNIGL